MKRPNTRAAKKAAANTKKGSRTIAPKKAPLVKQAKMQQVRFSFLWWERTKPNTSFAQGLAAKIGKSIEKQMVDAASSGKLTIMKSLISDE